MTTKQKVIVLLYTSHLYEAVREGFLKSRKQELERHLSANFNLDVTPISRSLPHSLITNRHFSPLNFKRSREATKGVTLQEKFSNIAPRLTDLAPKDPCLDAVSNIQTIEDDLSPTAYERNFPMPEIVGLPKIYHTLSTIFLFYASFKYLFISMVQYDWVSLNPVYLCYLPGRLTYIKGLTYEIPLMMFLIVMLHIIHRAMWNLGKERKLDLSCFVFLCFDQTELQRKLERVDDLNQPNLSQKRTHEIYLKNRIFYQRYRTADHVSKYKIRTNRTMKHRKKLEAMLNFIPFVYYGNLLIVILPVMILTCINFTSSEVFDQSYFACRPFANRLIDDGFEWSFFDPYRQLAAMFDISEFLFFFPELSFALVLPFCASLLLTHDLSLYSDSVLEELTQMKAKLELFHDLINHSKQLEKDIEKIKRLEMDIKDSRGVIYGDLMGLFEEVCKSDDFIRFFAPFCIFTWFVLNIAYQILSLFKHKMLLMHAFVQVMQAMGIVLMTFSFVGLARPYKKSMKLYTLLCSVAAMDTNRDTRTIWPRLLDFYHKRRPRYTLHIIGKTYALSALNYLRSMSWFFTCTILLMNLVSYKRK